MKKISIKFVAIIIIAFALSCEKESTISDFDQTLVVEAFLYAGEKNVNVRLTALLPYSSEVDEFQSINDADVVLTNGDNTYPLTPLGEDGKYFYDGNDLEIKEGETYNFATEYYGEQITASTTVPAPPTGVSISESSIYISESLAYTNMREFMLSVPEIDLSWNYDYDDYFCVLVDNIEETPLNIEFLTDRTTKFSFISQPVQRNELKLSPQSILQQYGQHSVRVFRVNEEYADLYETAEQDSRSLNEPATNINNGLGIFTAFNCDTVYLNIIKRY